jgi:hypothetical protein
MTTSDRGVEPAVAAQLDAAIEGPLEPGYGGRRTLAERRPSETAAGIALAVVVGGSLLGRGAPLPLALAAAALLGAAPAAISEIVDVLGQEAELRRQLSGEP